MTSRPRRPTRRAARRERRAAGRPAEPSYASGARILSIGIASTGIFTFLYLALASHELDRGRLRPHLAVLVGHVRDPVGDLPPDRATALADDRRPPGARAARPSAADPGTDPVRLRAAVPGRRAGDAPPRSSRACSTARARCTGSWSSACSPTRPATSLAAGWPVTSASRCTAGWCSSSRPRASCSRSPWRSASRPGRTAVGLGMAVAPFASLVRGPVRVLAPARRHAARRRRRAGCRRRPRGPGPRRDRGGRRRPELATAPASRSRWSAIMLAEQTLMNAGVLIVAATAGTGGLTSAHRLRVQRAADRRGRRCSSSRRSRPRSSPTWPASRRARARRSSTGRSA